MSELRKDPVSNIWVVLAPERKRRPLFHRPTGDDVLLPGDCPFCEGNEEMTTPEIYALRGSQSEADRPGWRLRVIPNKYPALQVEGQLNRVGDGFYDKMNGIGAHEVVIETPFHTKGMDELEVEAVTDIFMAFKRRILDLKKDIRFRYIQVFKNHGSMTIATVPHPHSQVVALPVVPVRIQEQLTSAKNHFNARERCIFCDMIHHERNYRKRVLEENSDYVVISPYAPRVPFELTIYPQQHGASYEETPDSSLRLLAGLFRGVMGKLNKALERPDYSMMLHNAPFEGDYGHYYHWHIKVMPVIAGVGVFDLGTGVYINPFLPEEVIEILKG
jgi:UDPglucose--hexose-1-phosphate uridylyltransferase